MHNPYVPSLHWLAYPFFACVCWGSPVPCSIHFPAWNTDSRSFSWKESPCQSFVWCWPSVEGLSTVSLLTGMRSVLVPSPAWGSASVLLRCVLCLPSRIDPRGHGLFFKLPLIYYNLQWNPHRWSVHFNKRFERCANWYNYHPICAVEGAHHPEVPRQSFPASLHAWAPAWSSRKLLPATVAQSCLPLRTRGVRLCAPYGPRFTLTVVRTCNLFLWLAAQYSTLWAHHGIHLPAAGRLGCPHFLAVKTRVTVNICEQGFGWLLWSRTARPHGEWGFSFIGNHQLVFTPWLYHPHHGQPCGCPTLTNLRIVPLSCLWSF